MRNVGRVVGLVGALLFASATALGQPSGGVDPKAAEEFAGQAYEQYNKGNFAQAVALYQKAYQASPSGAILFNIAKIYDQKLRDRELASEFYRRYLQAPDTEVELVKKANERLAVFKAERDAASTPAPTRPASSAPAPTSPPPTPPPPPEDNGKAYRTAGVFVGGVGGVGLIIGSIFGFRAMSKKSDADKFCNGRECTDQRGVTSLDDARSAGTVSTVGIVAGAVLVGGGVALYLMAPSPSRTGVYVKPSVSPGLAALSLGGGW